MEMKPGQLLKIGFDCREGTELVVKENTAKGKWQAQVKWKLLWPNSIKTLKIQEVDLLK